MTAAQVIKSVGPYVDRGQIPGAVVGVWRDVALSFDAAGATHLRGGAPLSAETPVRISSNTKTLVAALALALVDDGVLALHDPVEQFVPELSRRRLDAPLDDTLPAQRLATVEDRLTMRLGLGSVFEDDCPAVGAAASVGLGIGSPDPSVPLSPDAWIARFAELPLLEQPGAVWRYDLACAVLGVVLARAGGRPLEDLLRERLLNP